MQLLQNNLIYNTNYEIFERVEEMERYEMDVERRIAAGNRTNRALAALMRRRNVSTAVRLAVHNAVLVPTLLYGSETWVLQIKGDAISL